MNALVEQVRPALVHALHAKNSNANMATLRAQLKTDFLTESLSDDSQLIALQDSELAQYTGEFTHRELNLLRFFVNNVALKRLVRNDDHIEDGELLSPREAARRGVIMGGLGELDDTIAFVMECSLLTPRCFVGSHGRQITVHLNRIDDEALSRLTSRRKDFDYLEDNVINRTFSLGQAQFTRSFNPTISYRVERPDGHVFEWDVTHAEDFFASRHVLRAKAYRLIITLRLLGYNNSCVNAFYNIVTNEALPVNVRQKELSDAMHILFPDWGKPHVSIASHLDLSAGFVSGFEEDEMFDRKRICHHREVNMRSGKQVRFSPILED